MSALRLYPNLPHKMHDPGGEQQVPRRALPASSVNVIVYVAAIVAVIVIAVL